MVALLVAAHYPDLRVVVAAVPSSVVWSTFGSSRTSMFSRAGQPLPYLPYGLGRGSGVHNLFDDGLNALAEYPDATIPVEEINGPVMVICGKLDLLWPSCRMSAQVGARLEVILLSTHFRCWSMRTPDIRCLVRRLLQRSPPSPRLEAQLATRPGLILAKGSDLHWCCAKAQCAIAAKRKLRIPPLAPQRRQTDAGGIEAAIHRQHLAGDVARLVAAQEADRVGELRLEAVAVERDMVVIVGPDFGVCTALAMAVSTGPGATALTRIRTARARRPAAW